MPNPNQAPRQQSNEIIDHVPTPQEFDELQTLAGRQIPRSEVDKMLENMQDKPKMLENMHIESKELASTTEFDRAHVEGGEFDHLLADDDGKQISPEEAAVRKEQNISSARAEVERQAKSADLNTKFGPLE